MHKLAVGVIGCGAISPLHLDAVASDERLELLSVCDINAQTRTEASSKYICEAQASFRDLLHDARIQVVHILLPHDLHVPVAAEALRAGKHVILEKPVGIHFPELSLLEDVQTETGKRVGVIFQNRFNPTVVAAKRMIAEGTFGQLIGAKGLILWDRRGAYYSHSDWRGQKAREGGGLLIIQAIHMLDLLRYLGGEIACLEGFIANTCHPDIDVEDTAMATLHYRSGGVANFYGTNNHGDNSNVELELIFEKKSLRILDNRLYHKEPNGKWRSIVTDSGENPHRSYWGTSHLKAIRSIYTSFIDGTPLFVPYEEAVAATALVLGIYESAQSHETYVFERQFERKLVK